MSERASCIDVVSPEEFGKIFPQTPTVFDSAAFAMLNASKASEVEGFVLRDSSGLPVSGQILGLRDGVWRAPFSAPFSVLSGDVSRADEFYTAVAERLKMPLRLVWAPDCYGFEAPHEVNGVEVIAVEANFHYPLAQFESFKDHLSRSARYNHNYAMRQPFAFFHTDDAPRAYDIIQRNRRAMGYPLAMSLDDVLQTIKIIPADFFILQHDGSDAAAAMVFHVAPHIVQLIYWGDLPEVRQSKAMNHLAYRVIEWYAINCVDIDILDVGPASTMGVRNEGLCEFKRSIGCIETPKQVILINRLG